jgi:hypothetical protein
MHRLVLSRVPRESLGNSKKWGHFGRILHQLAVLPLAAATSGISPRSPAEDSLLDFSLRR